VVVFVSAASAEQAGRIAAALVKEKLAACGTVIRGARSVYRWKGEVRNEAEALLILKTKRSRFRALEERVRALHSYETPEVIALPIVAGSEPYLRWLRDGCAT
jgi:periplasmic divalent cation tolerance protein